MSETRYCIICGDPFSTDDPKAVLCPAHSGKTPSNSQQETKLDADPQFTIHQPGDPDETQFQGKASIDDKNQKRSKDFVPPAQDLTDWQVGDVILDTYEVKGELGKGGFGKVYRAHHKGWNMDLAVKRALKLDEENKQDFIDEAQHWIDLGLHPHIISCYYVRNIDGFPHTFAELAEGGSLESWIQGSEYDLYSGEREQVLGRILDLAIQFAWGLGYAHEQGLVHQDVKPHNALMTPDGVLKVTDFGLAKAKGATSATVQRGTGAGFLVSGGSYTPAYCSPEQAARRKLSFKTDIWSWGVSVLEMFNGGITWMGGQVAASALESYLGRAGEEEDIPPMPGAVAELLRVCFEADPQARPKDMLSIADRLISIYDQEIGQAYTRVMPKASELRSDSLNNKALSLLDLGRQAEAEELLHQAYALDKANPYAAYNLSHFLWGLGKIDDSEVLSRLEVLLQSYPDRSLSAYLLGYTYLWHGDYKLAIAILSEYRESEAFHSLVSRAEQYLPGAGLNKIIKGHSSVVNAVAFSPDGRFVLSGSWDKTLKLWDPETGKCLKTLKGHANYVKAVCFSPDGSRILSFGEDDSLRLWDSKSGKCLREIKADKTYGHHDKSVQFSPDGKYAISSGGESFFCLWETNDWTCLKKFQTRSIQSIQSIAFSPDGDHILSGRNDGKIDVWDVRSGDCLRTFQGHEGRLSMVLSLAFSPDGSYALSGGYDHMVRLWDVNTWDCIQELRGHQHKVNCVDFSPDGKHAVSVSMDKSMRVWDIQKAACLRTFETGPEEVLSVAYDPNNRFIASAGKDAYLHLWDVNALGQWEAPFTLAVPLSSSRASTQNEIFALKIKAAFKALERGEVMTALALAREAREIPGFEREESALKLWSLLSQRCRPGKLRSVWRTKTLQGHEWVVSTAAFSPDQRHVISGSWDKTLRLWDVDRGECLKTMQDGGTSIWSAGFSPDSKSVAAASGDIVYDYPADCFLRLWDVDSGECRKIIRGHESPVNSVAFSPDGRFLLSASDTLRLWDVQTGQCLQTFVGHPSSVKACKFSPDGRFAVSAGAWDQAIRLWDVKTGACMRTFNGHKEEVFALAFSACGQYILSGGHDGDMRLWHQESGKCLKILKGHEGWVKSVALSPDLGYALSGSYDKTMRLWDVTSGKCVQILDKSIETITSVDFSSDGTQALAGSGDKDVKLFFIDRELNDYQSALWDEGALPYLKSFLTLHTPYVGHFPQGGEPTKEEITLALTRHGKPSWTEDDFQGLMCLLGRCGYGWLREEGVRRRVDELAAERGQNE